jgi:hypothetical protein
LGHRTRPTRTRLTVAYIYIFMFYIFIYCYTDFFLFAALTVARFFFLLMNFYIILNLPSGTAFFAFCAVK